MESLILGLVNVGDSVRAVTQRELVQKIAAKLQSLGYKTSIIEVSDQRLRSAEDFGLLRLRWHVLKQTIAQDMHHLREFRRRRNRPVRISLRKRIMVLRRSLASTSSKSDLLHAFGRLEVEAAVSRKHLRIWEQVVLHKAPGAVVFEDDFSFRTTESLEEVASLVRLSREGLDLIDFAGGLNWVAMGLPPQSEGDLKLELIAANTACAYFISYAACEALLRMVESRPDIVYLSPDFLISELNNAGFAGSTFLPKSPPLVHGSREGIVESSIPY